MRQELASLRSSSETAIQELEAQIAKKKEILTRKREYIAKVEALQGKTKSLLYAANEKVKAIEEQATTVATRAIEDYKKTNELVQKVIEAAVDAHMVGFTNGKKRLLRFSLSWT